MVSLRDGIFLLGGKDLEMLEIAVMLKNMGLTFVDKGLEWGAKLSDYTEYLNGEDLFIGVELRKDINPPDPEKYVEIDHHNEHRNLPSSLEQLAKLLNVELSRRQMLIALNDKGYIPAMKAFGATAEEIENIRKADRRAQGVTPADELLAEEAVRDAVRHGTVAVVKYKGKRFSPVVDRLSESRLIIYNERSLNYYGDGISLVVNAFDRLLREGKAYYGGGDPGYFGVVESVLSKNEITKVKDTILNIFQRNM